MSPDATDWSTPNVRGLNDSEIIEWSGNAGVSIMLLMRSSCCPLLLVIVAAGALYNLAEAYPAALLLAAAIVSPIALIVALVLLLYGIYLLIQVKRTTYVITSQRLLEVRGGSIKKEIPKADLHGLEPSQYLKSVWAQKHAGQQTYNITYNIYVTDSVSGVVMRMTSVDGAVADRIERWVSKSKA